MSMSLRKKSASLNFRVTEELRDMLKAVAEADNRTSTNWLESRIRQEYENLQKEKHEIPGP